MTHLWTTISSILLAFTGLFMIFIILLQRGRGGGLAGAFGAMGGQSAFGTKAGDVFTKITIGVAVIWVALAAVTGYAMRAENSHRFESQAPAADAPPKVEAVPKKAGDVGKDGEDPFAKTSDPAKTAPAATDKAAPKVEPAKPLAPAKDAAPPKPSPKAATETPAKSATEKPAAK
jgi:preprotein translocase subunit SecG